jgi:hypothetical protein
MQELNKSSRRSFLGKLGAGSLGLALSPGLMLKPDASAGLNRQPKGAAGFVSDKKFVPVMLTPFNQDGQIDYEVLAKLMPEQRDVRIEQ